MLKRHGKAKMHAIHTAHRHQPINTDGVIDGLQKQPSRCLHDCLEPVLCVNVACPKGQKRTARRMLPKGSASAPSGHTAKTCCRFRLCQAHSSREPSSQPRDQTHVASPLQRKPRVLTHGLSGNPRHILRFFHSLLKCSRITVCCQLQQNGPVVRRTDKRQGPISKHS